MNTELQDRVYIVTGGSRGIGLAIAQCLVHKGAKVALLGRNTAALKQAVGELGEGQALGIEVDVADRQNLIAAFQDVVQHFGRLDGLVNNAGVARPGRIEHLVEQEVLMQVHINYLGTVFACQGAIPLLRGGDNPRIINISSASTHHYDEASHLSIYASTKAAVERFTRDLGLELQADGIGVTCLRPGSVPTGFAEGWDEEAMLACLEAWRHAGSYMNVGMESEQVAEAVAFALAQPPGVAVDLLEIRPKKLQEK